MMILVRGQMQKMPRGTSPEITTMIPNVPLEDFHLDLRFEDLKLFKRELADFSLKKRFEFQYV